VELDPGFAPYHLHPINIAFKYKPDSARVATLIERYERFAPGSKDSRTARIAFDLAFGDPESRETALAGLDTLDLDLLAPLPMDYLLHPRFWPEFEAAMLALNRRGSESGRPFRTWFLFWAAAGGRGYLQRALEYLEEPRVSVAQRACLSQLAHTTGLPLPEERLEEVAALASQIDSTSSPWWVVCVGTYAADRGRWADYARAIENLEEQARRALSLGDSALAEGAKAQAQRLEGYGLWRRGNLEAAVRILEGIPRDEADDVMRWWLGQLYLEQERWRDAVPYLRSYWWTPLALSYYYLGQAYERLEEYAEARKAYAYFVSAWQDADPELQPRVEAARRALVRLTAERPN
jgi:tetratricopeptide (TPR) repeat protein